MPVLIARCIKHKVPIPNLKGKIVDLDSPDNLKSKYNLPNLEGVFLKLTGKSLEEGEEEE